MPDFEKLPIHDRGGNVHVVVESPRGSLAKLKFEPELQAFVFERALQLGMAYPYDWGFVPGTRAEDGDPLDAMVLFDAPTWPGVVIPSVPIGMVCLTQRKSKGAPTVRNDRIIALAAGDERCDDVRDLPKRVRTELEQFFVTASRMTGKRVMIEGWKGAAAARKAIERAGRRHQRGEGAAA